MEGKRVLRFDDDDEGGGGGDGGIYQIEMIFIRVIS